MRTAGALEGQVALVTGGGKGIGRAIALELAARGARVLVSGREEHALADVVGEIAHGGGTARHVVGDVRDEQQVRTAVLRAADLWGRLDAAVANAGVSGAGPLGRGGGPSAEESRARVVFETNLLGAYYLFDAAVAVMKGPGRLIAISSVLGKFGVAGQAAYCASKAGLHGLVRAAAVELGGRRITCNAVCCGWVDTDMARARLAELAAERGLAPAAMATQARAEVPLGRFVEAEEVARLVAYLCGTDGAAVTGQALSICGGTTPFAG
jgi:3-oxoacyl-[acyl-carrier protein] reductase